MLGKEISDHLLPIDATLEVQYKMKNLAGLNGQDTEILNAIINNYPCGNINQLYQWLFITENQTLIKLLQNCIALFNKKNNLFDTSTYEQALKIYLQINNQNQFQMY